METGEYSIHAVATFSDDTQEKSNSLTLIIQTRSKSHEIYLQAGWNTVSTYILPNDNDITTIFGGIKDHIAMVTNNEGNVYWPSLDINEIGRWDYREGYQIYMDLSDTLILQGLHIQPDETPIQLTQGWNLTGYILDHPVSIENALVSIEHTLQIVTNNSGQIYWPENGINTIDKMIPGQGYKIFTDSDSELIYPSASVFVPRIVNNTSSSQKSDIQAFSSKRYAVEQGNTGVSSILLVESQNFLYGSEVGVWTDTGKLVGSGVVVNGKTAITIWGKNPLLKEQDIGADVQDALRLTMWSAGEGKEYPLKIVSVRALGDDHQYFENLLFEPDAILIAVVEVENSVPQRYSLEQNFPNPFNPSTMIRFEIPDEVEVKLEVYNLLGQKLKTLVDEVRPAGYHQILFTAENISSGVYFYRLQAGRYTEVKKMILLH
jgi:hypothetical protein